MKAPFIWFGGKRRVADVVWSALGDVDNFVEPFAGSLAVLLERPRWHRGNVETVNDRDAYLANFWRALAANPDEVAGFADWPVNETDLLARHLWLVNEGRARIARLESDPEFYDPKVAGWWVWGINAWIGSGWCSGPHTVASVAAGREPEAPAPGRPGAGADGEAEARQLPHLGDPGQGVNRKLPHLGDPGQGVNGPDGITEAGGSGAPRNVWDRSFCRDGEAPLYGLRRVRVCCGDWSRVVSYGATGHGATVGVLLDPPYSDEDTTSGLYSSEEAGLSAAVREWAIERGSDPRYRIALCGYEGEHEMPANWRKVHGKATAAYQTAARAGATDGGNQENRRKERIWFSPACLNAAPSLFAGVTP